MMLHPRVLTTCRPRVINCIEQPLQGDGNKTTCAGRGWGRASFARLLPISLQATRMAVHTSTVKPLFKEQ